MIPGKGLRKMYDQKLANTTAELTRVYEHQDELRHLLASHLEMDPDESLETLIDGVRGLSTLYKQMLERFQEIREQCQVLKHDYGMLVAVVQGQIHALQVGGSQVDGATVTLRAALRAGDHGKAE